MKFSLVVASFIFVLSALAHDAATAAYVERCTAALDKFGGKATTVSEGIVTVDKVTYWHSDRTLAELRKNAYRKGELAKERLLGRKVLDLPCGEGSTTKSLHAEGVSVTGVDILLDPKNNPPPFLIQADWHHLPFPDHTFNTVLMNNGIFIYSHQYSDAALKQALGEAIRVKAVDGEILLTGAAEPERLERLASEMGLVQLDKYESHDDWTDQKYAWTYRFQSKR